MYVDTNWELKKNHSARTWPQLTAFGYDLVKNRVENWWGVQAGNPDGSTGFYYVHPTVT